MCVMHALYVAVRHTVYEHLNFGTCIKQRGVPQKDKKKKRKKEECGCSLLATLAALDQL